MSARVAGATRAFEVKRALFDLIETTPALAETQVSYGHPKEVERRSIFVGKVEWESSEWATNRARQEQFSVSVRLGVYILGGTAREAEDECQALTKDFEGALKVSPNLGLSYVVTSDCQPVELDSAPAADGWAAGIDYEVRFTARY